MHTMTCTSYCKGIVLGVTVAASELVQGLTPLWCKYLLWIMLCLQ